jgi:hypothetical protein
MGYKYQLFVLKNIILNNINEVGLCGVVLILAISDNSLFSLKTNA